MTIAEIHGKSPLTTSEDFLTADVFTAFRYLPADSGIAGFLRSIEGVPNIIPAVSERASAEFFFWPLGCVGQLERAREPDVLVELDIDGTLYHIVVEAKYLSGPSDYETVEIERDEEIVQWGNQLADQLRELGRGEYTVYQQGTRDMPKMLTSRRENRLLLYLTAHPLKPVAEMARARALGRPHWTSWYDVYDYLAGQQEHLNAFPYNRILEDVLTLLRLKGFSSFEGVAWPPQLELDENSGSFWLGRSKPLPPFYGIRQPPVIALSVKNGSFWKEQENRI